MSTEAGKRLLTNIAYALDPAYYLPGDNPAPFHRFQEQVAAIESESYAKGRADALTEVRAAVEELAVATYPMPDPFAYSHRSMDVFTDKGTVEAVRAAVLAILSPDEKEPGR